MFVEVIGPSLTKPGHAGKCWSKEQEPGMLWILKHWVNCQSGLGEMSAGSARSVAPTPPG